MKIPIILAVSFLCLASAEQPWTQTAEYETLGHKVIEYSRGYNTAYQIFNGTNLVAECNLAGFVEWKKQRLMFLIGQSSTSSIEREQYKLQYEELSRRQDSANSLIASMIMAKRQQQQQQFQESTNQLFQNSRERTNRIFERKR